MKNKNGCTEMPDDEKTLPRISLIIPYNPKMKTQAGMFNLLSAAADKTERELLNSYPEQRVMPVIKKLRSLIKGLHCNKSEKSIGIFVSPVAEKVYFFTPSTLIKNYVPPVLVQTNHEWQRELVHGHLS